MAAQEWEIVDPPSDGISAVVFSPQAPNFLLASSWDSTLRLYDVFTNETRSRFVSETPLLDCCFSDGSHSFSGGLDKSVRAYDLNRQAETTLGSHSEAVRCVNFSTDTNMLLTGSWDSTVKQWDPRANSAQGTFTQPGKVYTMDLTDRRLVVGTAGRHVYIYDIRNLNETLQKRESSLKYQTRTIRCFPNGDGYALGSIQGRVAVEYFDPAPEMQKKKFAFRCHRTKQDGVETVFPVNAITFHSKHGTFATGGCDGVVNVWDPFNQKRLREFPKYPSSIASLSFSCDGKHLAVASSYTWEEGPKDHNPDSIFIRPLVETDTKPKPKTNA